MMTTHTQTALRQVKPGGIATAPQSQLDHAGTHEGLIFTERLALLVEQTVCSGPIIEPEIDHGFDWQHYNISWVEVLADYRL